MPKYKVTTDQGAFHVELDRAPDSPEQLQEIVQQQFAHKAFDQTQAYQKSEFDRLSNPSVPQGGGRVEPMLKPKQESPESQVFGTIGKMNTELGKKVQSAVEPYVGATGSDIAGALTQELANFFTPQAGSTVLRGAAKGLARILPGAQGGRMESLIGGSERSLQDLLERSKKSQAVAQGAVNQIPATDITALPNTLKKADEIIAYNAAHGIDSSPVLTDANRLKKVLPGGTESLKWIDEELSDIGKKTKAVQGVAADPRYKELFGAMATDLESTKPTTLGTGQTVQPSGLGRVIRDRDKATRRTKGIDDVIDQFNNLVKTKRGSGGAQDINANQLIDKLRKNEFLQESLRPEDWKEIEPLLTKLADTAALPPPSGVSYGSGRAMARGSVAGGLSYLLGGDPVSTGAAVTGLDYIVGHALMTRPGRQMIKGILEMEGLEKSQRLNFINAGARLLLKGKDAVSGGDKTLEEIGLR